MYNLSAITKYVARKGLRPINARNVRTVTTIYANTNGCMRKDWHIYNFITHQDDLVLNRTLYWIKAMQRVTCLLFVNIFSTLLCIGRMFQVTGNYSLRCLESVHTHVFEYLIKRHINTLIQHKEWLLSRCFGTHRTICKYI
jgi:hypothetical protein